MRSNELRACVHYIHGSGGHLGVCLMYSYIYTSYIHKYTYIGYERLCVYVYVYIYVYSAREDGVQVPLQSGCSGRSAPTKRPDRVFACVPHVQCCVWRAAFCFFCRLDQGVCVLASCLPALCPAFSAPGVHLLAFGPAPRTVRAAFACVSFR